MRRVFSKKAAIFAFVVFVSLILLSGCVHLKCGHYKPIVIKNAPIGMNFVAGGKIIFFDEDGKPIPYQSFKEILDWKYEKGSNWKIEKVQTINIYHMTGSQYVVYEIDGQCVCLQYSDDFSTYEGPCQR